ncbi:MAG: hypothetical protein RL347_2259 [Actinomycetota bacterium]|jgi:hypothetical protein
MTEAELRDIGGVPASARLIRVVLSVGAAFFIVAGVLLLFVPDSFGAWIGLETSDAVAWTLRMLGAALIGLGGQMWLVRRAGDHPVLGAGAVMIVAGGAMTILTVTLPGDWTPMRWALLGVGAVFVIAYGGLLIASRRL